MIDRPRRSRFRRAMLLLILWFAGGVSLAQDPAANPEPQSGVTKLQAPASGPTAAPVPAEVADAGATPEPELPAEAAGASATPDVELPAAAASDGPPVEPPAAVPAPSPLIPFIERGMELWNVPGLAVAVVSSESIQFRQGFGTTAVEGGVPVDEHTLFAIASTTKAMVAAGLLILADEGRLTLDDRVTLHLPEVHFSDPSLTAQVRVRDLLSHRTGLPSTDLWYFFQRMPLEEQIERLPLVAPQAPLRDRLIYQNTMFELAGLIIERVSGQSWDRFLAERLWRPIGMLDTYGTRAHIGPQQSRVTPYYYLDGRLSEADWDIPADHADAAGSVWSCVHDMSLWAQFLLRGGVTGNGMRLLSEAALAEMFEPQQLAAKSDFYPTAELTQPHWRSYGLGWFQQDFQGRKIDYHTGSLAGLVAIIGLDRAGDRAVVVLANRDHAEMRHALLWEVMDHRLADARPDWNQDVFDLYQRLEAEREARWEETRKDRLSWTRPSLPLEEYAGIYRSEANGDLRVDNSQRGLVLSSKRIDLATTHWHLDTFVVEYRPWNLREFATFQIGTDGKVRELQVLGDRFLRVPDP